MDISVFDTFNDETKYIYGRRHVESPDLLQFTRFFYEHVDRQEFDVNYHHKLICDKLNSILKYEHPTNNLIINIPPRHSKSQLAVIDFISLAFAINPQSEIMHLSSSELLVTRNCTLIRQIMESPYYMSMFPDTEIVNNAKTNIITSKGGNLYTAPFLGQITGFGCGKLGSEKFSGAMIIDDPIKTQDALSETIREKVNFTWANTIISRKNDIRTPVIVIGQRTHENDFCGFLMERHGTIENGGVWDTLVIPAITTDEVGNEKALWEKRIPLKELKEQKELDSWVFETQYMQDPKPIEGLLFHENTTKYYDNLPDEDGFRMISIDPADEGNDYLCSVFYKVLGDDTFVVDVIYTKDSSDITVPRIMQQISEFNPSLIRIEANGAGMFFANSIKRRVSELGLSTQPRAYKSVQNKEIRILEQAPYINRSFYYPKNSDNAELKMYLKHKHSYLKMVKDQKDDGVDTDSATCEYLRKNGIIPRI